MNTYFCEMVFMVINCSFKRSFSASIFNGDQLYRKEWTPLEGNCLPLDYLVERIHPLGKLTGSPDKCSPL